MKTNFTLMEYNTFAFGLNSNCWLLATVPAWVRYVFFWKESYTNCFCCEICLSCVYNNNTIIYFLQDQTSYTKPELSEEEKHR